MNLSNDTPHDGIPHFFNSEKSYDRFSIFRKLPPNSPHGGSPLIFEVVRRSYQGDFKAIFGGVWYIIGAAIVGQRSKIYTNISTDAGFYV